MKGIKWSKYEQSLTLSKTWALVAVFSVLGMAALLFDTLTSIRLW